MHRERQCHDVRALESGLPQNVNVHVRAVHNQLPTLGRLLALWISSLVDPGRCALLGVVDVVEALLC
jgi:hypothetical protein